MAKATYTLRKLETAPYDKRVVARQISGGVVSYKDLSKHLSDLADSADNAEEITVTLEEEEEEATEEVEEEATEEPAAEA
jgi:hypothetical protein